MRIQDLVRISCLSLGNRVSIKWLFNQPVSPQTSPSSISLLTKTSSCHWLFCKDAETVAIICYSLNKTYPPTSVEDLRVLFRETVKLRRSGSGGAEKWREGKLLSDILYEERVKKEKENSLFCTFTMQLNQLYLNLFK